MSRDFNAIEIWFSFRRNVNFWAWVRDWYTDDELIALQHYATDIILTQCYDWLHDPDKVLQGDHLEEKLIRHLMKRYGNEIVQCCLAEGGFDANEGRTGVPCLVTLNLATQVHNRNTLHEFLVRNALKRAARQLLKEGRRKRK